jgi:Flp pilus assembly protein TadG
MRRIFSFCRDVWRDRSGVVALEFALSANVMLIFILGTVEASNAIRLQAKLNVTVGQLAEFVAGQSLVTAPTGTLADLCNGAAMNLAPYPANALAANIVSMSNDHPSNRVANSTDSTTVNTYLDWESISSCATQASSTLTLAGAFPLANTPLSLLTKSGASASGTNDTTNLKYGYSAIVVKVQYSYTNVFTYFLGQTINFSALAIVRPRSNTTIQCTNTGGSTACRASS